MNEPVIHRDLQRAQEARHDLIVVGGGVHGVMMALEAARRGLKPLLIERDDFGSGTSWNSLRIVHGGLRYLQSFDLPRFRESVAERRWFMRNLPDLVAPLACLMPLYGNGLRRPTIFRAALKLNDLFSAKRNDGVADASRLAGGRVLSPAKTAERFAAVDRAGLRGGALWHDAIMLSSERILIELLRWACACGATALNYVEAMALGVEEGRVTGVEAIDAVTQEPYTFTAPVVVNCAGPWCGIMSAKFDRDVPHLFRPALAFNLLIDRPPLSDAAVAVAPRRRGARTYFLVPWKGRIFAGTYHAPFTGRPMKPTPSLRQIDDFLDDVNQAVPGLSLGRRDIMRVYAGLMPTDAAESPEPSTRPTLIDHQHHGGPSGLFSLSGVKFTTARHVAQTTLQQIYSERNGDLPLRDDTARPHVGERAALCDSLGLLASNAAVEPAAIAQLARDESVVHLDDLLLRRCDWTGTRDQAAQHAPAIAAALGYDEKRITSEIARLHASFDGVEPIGKVRTVEVRR